MSKSPAPPTDSTAATLPSKPTGLPKKKPLASRSAFYPKMPSQNKRRLAHLSSLPSSPTAKKQRRDGVLPLHPSLEGRSENTLSSGASTLTSIGSPASSPPAQNLHPSVSSDTSSNGSSEDEESGSSSSSGVSDSDLDSNSDANSDLLSEICSELFEAGMLLQEYLKMPHVERLRDAPSISDPGSTSDSTPNLFTSISASISDETSSTHSLSSSAPASGDDTTSSSSSPSSSSSEAAESASSSSLSSSDSINPSQSSRISASFLSADNLLNLQSRLKALIPRIRYANEELEVKRHEGRLGERNIENVDEDKEEDTEAGGKAYIQMDLGLGVLEERREDEETDGSEGSSKGDTENSVVSAKDHDERNILETLLGEKQKRKGREKIGIQEVGDI